MGWEKKILKMLNLAFSPGSSEVIGIFVFRQCTLLVPFSYILRFSNCLSCKS